VAGPRDDVVAETERWFLARGTPHLIEDYSATTDVFTRAAPVLTFLFLVSVAGTGQVDWRWWQNALAVIAGSAVLLGTWALVNRARGRPALQRPDTIGPVELTVFVAAPALLQLIGGQARAALVTAVLLALLLGLVYVVTSYALLPMTRWALAKTVHELRAVVALLARALPLLLLIQIVLFINTEMWQVAAGFSGELLAVVVALFAAVGTVFLFARLPGEIDRASSFADAAEVHVLCRDTPVRDVAPEVVDGAVAAQPLSRRQRGNVLLVALFSQGLQVLVVGTVLGLFFVLFGVLAVTPAVVESWLGHPGDALVEWEVAGNPLVVTTELLKLSGFLAAFGALYFSVTLVTDTTYREEFFEEVLAELRQTFAVRAVYLGLRASAAFGEAGAGADSSAVPIRSTKLSQ
jgi:hypothetical protein